MEQIQVEFSQEMMQLQQLQQLAPTESTGSSTVTTDTAKDRSYEKRFLIAEMTEEFMKEEKNITSQFDHDPLLKLKSREVDLRAMDQQQ